jgi:hypothetical protein
LLLASGVTDGQVVVTAGVHLLKPQQRVTILEEVKTDPHAEPYLSAQTLLKAAQHAPYNQIPDHQASPVKSGAEK